jgi:hypothetical protein
VKRLLRRALRFVPLMLALLTIGAWIESRRAADTFWFDLRERNPGGARWFITINHGDLRVESHDLLKIQAFMRWRLFRIPMGVQQSAPTPLPPGYGRWGFCFDYDSTPMLDWRVGRSQWTSASVPLWLFVLPVFAQVLLILRRRLRPTPAEPHCLECGYDLRATPDRCPECGTTVFR